MFPVVEVEEDLDLRFQIFREFLLLRRALKEKPQFSARKKTRIETLLSTPYASIVKIEINYVLY